MQNICRIRMYCNMHRVSKPLRISIQDDVNLRLTSFSFCFQISLRIFRRSADEATRRCEQSARFRDRPTYVFINEEACILIFPTVVDFSSLEHSFNKLFITKETHISYFSI